MLRKRLSETETLIQDSQREARQLSTQFESWVEADKERLAKAEKALARNKSDLYGTWRVHVLWEGDWPRPSLMSDN